MREPVAMTIQVLKMFQGLCCLSQQFLLFSKVSDVKTSCSLPIDAADRHKVSSESSSHIQHLEDRMDNYSRSVVAIPNLVNAWRVLHRMPYK